MSSDDIQKDHTSAERELAEKNERVAQLERKVGGLTDEVDRLKKFKEIVGPIDLPLSAGGRVVGRLPSASLREEHRCRGPVGMAEIDDSLEQMIIRITDGTSISKNTC